MSERIFLKRAYIGSDGDHFIEDFIAYLQNAAKNIGHAMSDRAIFLQGGEQAIREIIDELKQGASDE